MGVVARELAINASSVTRACEKLAALGLLQRARNPLNKREVLLAPTVTGRRVANRVDQARRAALSAVLDRLDPDTRSAVEAAFAGFPAAAESAPIPYGATA
jgi:DNA-binding MarR family transcriptional regulator